MSDVQWVDGLELLRVVEHKLGNMDFFAALKGIPKDKVQNMGRAISGAGTFHIEHGTVQQLLDDGKLTLLSERPTGFRALRFGDPEAFLQKYNLRRPIKA
jgi:hypothetical protein